MEQTENTAPRNVTEKVVGVMDSKIFEALLGYKSAMAQARLMRSKGLISDEEYTKIETKMCEKYGINFGSLYRDIDWINTPFDGNMDTEKEVV